MLKFSLTLPIILSSLYISFSQAQYYLPSCALSCAQAAGYQAGCDPCVPSSIHICRVLILPDPPRCRNDPTCVCTNDAFIGAASSCVCQSCSDSDARTAVDYWAKVCGGYEPSSGTGNHSPSIPILYRQLVTGSTPTETPSSYVPPSSRTSVSSSSGTGSSSSGYGYPTVTSSQPTTSTSITSSNPYPYGSSSASGSGSSSSASGSSSSSRPSSSTSSNLAATMPTHAAALIAGVIGAMVAVFV